MDPTSCIRCREPTNNLQRYIWASRENEFIDISQIIIDELLQRDLNVVNLKLIASVLLILAKDLGVLNRRFFVECDWLGEIPSPQISITEITIKAYVTNGETLDTTIKIAETPSQIAKVMAQAAYQAKGLKPKKTKQRKKSSEESDDQNKDDRPTDKEEVDKLSTGKKSSHKRTEAVSIDKKSSDKTKEIATTDKKSSTDKKSKGKSSTSATDSVEKIKSSSSSSNSSLSPENSSEFMSSSSAISDHSETKITKEKILILTGQTEPEPTRSTISRRLSLVTKEQFDALSKSVADLKEQYEIASSQGPKSFSSKKEQSQFYKSAPLTDPVAILQLSARLEAIEKSTDHILKLLGEISKPTRKITPKQQQVAPDKGGIDVVKSFDEDMKKVETKESKIYSKETDVKQVESKILGKDTSATQSKDKQLHDKSPESVASKLTVEVIKSKSITQEEKKYLTPSQAISTVSHLDQVPKSKVQTASSGLPVHCITQFDLRTAMRDLINSFEKCVTEITVKIINKANDSSKLAMSTDRALTQSMNLDRSLVEVEDAVLHYAEHINRLDSTFSSKMTHYQDLLTQMIYNMEKASDAMLENLAVSGEVTEEINDLSAQFNKFNIELESISMKQTVLKERHDTFQRRVVILEQEIVELDKNKSTREEVDMLLKDKAGIKDFNEMVDRDHFLAVVGSWQKQIRAAYDKFNSQEYMWQKLIDELQRNINKRADRCYLEILLKDIDLNIETLKKRIDLMLSILGEPRLPEPKKYLDSYYDDKCISCESKIQDKILPSADGDHRAVGKQSMKEENLQSVSRFNMDDLLEISQKCFPGKIMPPELQTKSSNCTRVCGGSFKKDLKWRSKIPNAEVVVEKLYPVTKTEGVSEINIELCLPCNKKPKMQKLSKPEILHSHGILRSSMMTPIPSLNPTAASYERVNAVNIEDPSIVQLSELKQVF